MVRPNGCVYGRSSSGSGTLHSRAAPWRCGITESCPLGGAKDGSTVLVRDGSAVSARPTSRVSHRRGLQYRWIGIQITWQCPECAVARTGTALCHNPRGEGGPSQPYARTLRRGHPQAAAAHGTRITHRNGPTWAAGMSLDKAGFAYQALDGQRPGCPRQSHLKISDMEATPGGCAGSTGPATAQPGESLHCDPRGPMLPSPSPGYPVPRPGRCGTPGAHAEGCRRASRAPRPPGVCQRRRPVAMRGPGSQSQDPLWGQYRAEIGQIASGFAPFDSHPEPDRRVSGAAD